MKPIYFPFTYIAESVARNLSGLFGPLIVFQPVRDRLPDDLRRSAENGWIDLKTPAAGDDDRLLAFFEEFKDWGHRHHGAETSLKAVFEAGFYNQDFVAQIRTDIVKNQKKAFESPDPEFLARLFLIMAQDLDARQMEIDRDMALSADRERELFTRMTGEEKNLDLAGNPLFQTDPGAHMTGQRLAAWFRLMACAPPESAFLVTDSPAVAALMTDRLENLERIASFDGVAWRQPADRVQKFNQMAAHLAVTPWSGRWQGELPNLAVGDGEDVDFNLYIVPGSAPGDLARFFSKIDDPEKTPENKYLNTILGVLGPPGKKI
jgi:hypothetical protein